MPVPVQYTVHEGVATLTLNRAKRRNALNSTLVQALEAALQSAARDETVRVVVLTGAGTAFSAGAGPCSTESPGDGLGRRKPGRCTTAGNTV